MSDDDDQTPQEGLLTRLDDKLDALEAAGRLSIPQLVEQYVGGGYEDGRPVQIRPGCGQRQPLKDAVRDLTKQWSEGFLALAYEGDAASCYIVAQMSFRPGGYGSIPYNRHAAVAWLMKAIDGGELEARGWARKIAYDEFIRHLAKKEVGEASEQVLNEAIERWKIKDKEMEAEEKILQAQRDAMAE